MPEAIIYALRCARINKVYVGGTKNFSNRKSKHLNKLWNLIHYNKYLQIAFNTYGAKSFRWQILERCDLGLKDKREAHWISHYRSMDPDYGFNYYAPPTYKRNGVPVSKLGPYPDVAIDFLSSDDIEAICECDLSIEEIADELHCGKEFISHIKYYASVMTRLKGSQSSMSTFEACHDDRPLLAIFKDWAFFNDYMDYLETT